MPKKVKGHGLRCGFVKAILPGYGMARCTEPKGHPFGEHKFGESKKPAPGKPVELKRAAEAVVKFCSSQKKFPDGWHIPPGFIEALRAELQRDDPAPNAVITNCISYDRVLDKAEVEVHWERYKAELQREEPEVEVPFKIVTTPGKHEIQDSAGRFIAECSDISDGREFILVSLANRAAPSDAGRELAEMVISGASIDPQEKWVGWEVMKAKAREVLGKKEGE